MPCKGCILVVDDDDDVREGLAARFAQLGCTAVVAVDGLDALEKLQQCPQPCLVLSDMNMPGLDGQGLARIIREGSCPRLRIISMSASHEQPDPLLVEGHLEKPFDFDVLLPTLERFCQDPTWWVKARTGE